jgi:murein DD-endopeptidase MepM/ murein hydrolase activator NlpD
MMSNHPFRSRIRRASLVTAAALLCTLAAAGPATAAPADTAAPAQWVSPMLGTVSEPFAVRTHPYVQMVSSCGTPVYAATAGTVVAATETGGQLGVTASINHGENILATYSNLGSMSLLVATGDRVEAGQQIAVSGNTGATLHCGLGLSIRDRKIHSIDLQPQDPVDFLAKRGVTLGD